MWDGFYGGMREARWPVRRLLQWFKEEVMVAGT